MLIKNYPNLKPVAEYVGRFDLLFQKNLKEVAQVLNIVSVYDSHYDAKFIRENVKKINQSFVILKKLIDFSNRLSTDATEYQKNLSILTIHFRKIVDTIWLFLHQHIMSSYDNNILKKCVYQISNYLTQLANQAGKLDVNTLNRIVDNLNSEIVYLEKIIKCLYPLVLKTKYLKIVHSQLEFYAEHSENFRQLNYSNLQINEIKNIIEDSKIILDKIKSNLYLFQFKYANKLIEYLFEQLVKLKKEINADKDAFSLVSKNIRNLNLQIDNFEQNFESVSRSLRDIEKNFAKNERISHLMKCFWDKVNEMKEKIASLRSYKSNAQQHYSEHLKYLVLVIDNIMECQEIMKTLIKTATSLREETNYNIQEVNKLKLLFAQIRVYIVNENLLLDNNYAAMFRDWEQKINEKIAVLEKNYNEFFDQIEPFLSQAYDNSKAIMKEIMIQVNFKQIAAACIAFVNKYINEHNSIYLKQKGFENLFLEGKYEKIIKKSIKMIKVIKQSADENDLAMD